MFHASIGSIYTPLDAPELDATKGRRILQIVDARTYAIPLRFDVGDVLAAAGHPGMSAAVRPMVLSPDERLAYPACSCRSCTASSGSTSSRAGRCGSPTCPCRRRPRRRKPYWATNSADGALCFVSASGDDKVTVIS